MIHKSILSLESIDFQDKSFFTNLTRCITDLRASQDWAAIPMDRAIGFFQSPMVLAIGETIQKHTSKGYMSGLLVVLTPNLNSISPTVKIPYFSNGNVLNTEFTKQYLNPKLPNSLSVIKKHLGANQAVGIVDIRKNLVGGVYSKIRNTLEINPATLFGYTTSLIKYILTPSQLAAILLHEIGHLFTSYEYLTRVNTTNQALAALANANDHPESNVKAAVIDLIARSEGLDEIQKVALEIAQSADDVGMILYAANVEKCVSELGDSVYDVTSIEYLADQYAARCGAGSELVHGLSIIRNAYPTALHTRISAGLMTIVSKLAMAAGYNSGFLLSAMIAADAEDTYDNEADRLIRIREQYVQHLKDRSLSADEKRDLLSDIDAIDVLMKSVANKDMSLFTKIKHLFSPRLKMSNKFKILQQDLERIGHNNLFVQSAKLSTVFPISK